MPEIIIVDTSVLIALEKIELLQILIPFLTARHLMILSLTFWV
jgi:hypothetical protein